MSLRGISCILVPRMGSGLALVQNKVFCRFFVGFVEFYRGRFLGVYVFFHGLLWL